MKKGIHPKLKTINVTCACGEQFQTLSVLDEIRVEICSKCHPFYTGKTKIVDTAGRVEKFMKKYAKVRKVKDAGKKSE
jgi:large subunit ribosomal protein L31